MFGEASESSELPAGTEAAMLDALGEALEELNQFREREGAEIAREMRGHNARVGALARARWKRSGPARRRFSRTASPSA